MKNSVKIIIGATSLAASYVIYLRDLRGGCGGPGCPDDYIEYMKIQTTPGDRFYDETKLAQIALVGVGAIAIGAGVIGLLKNKTK